jgi:hypothetical protein
MKNKLTAKFLLPVVLGIWGLIGWKVYAAINGSDEAVKSSEPVITKTAKSNLPDSLALSLDYRDPFLSKTEQKRSPGTVYPVIHPGNTTKPEQPKPATASWPKINYSGLVKHDAKTVGFLNVNGTSYFVQPGIIAGEVKVINVWKDSVQVEWGKERRVVGK